MKRRNFVKATPAILASGTVLANTPFPHYTKKALSKSNIKTVLFQGDSITDAGRDKQDPKPNSTNALGRGYAFLSAAGLLEEYPEMQLDIYNRGISGNKVFQLRDRWEEDCFALNPNVLSILIGVNDHWHSLRDYNGTPQVYREDYDNLLQKTKDQLPDIKLIICEPFILLDGKAIEKDKWIPVFDQYRTFAKELARKYKAEFVPFQSIFDKALEKAPASYWAPDGVHPALPGAQLMASHWLKAFKKCL